jgi:aspartyl-tRNA(Asn)/glutamyl-tRNA(Gln) amidotransferase subunit A
MSDLTTPLTIRHTLQAMQGGELTSGRLVEDTLERISRTDDEVHAWLDIRPQFLMEQATVADRRRSLPRPAPALLGIPLGIKDIIDVAGYATECNMRARKGIAPAVQDAEVVRRLRHSGALVMGKTVTQEAAAGVVSDPCRNPWDTDRIPGGSSGGTAAAITNGTSMAGLGTDTGGSIRIPAALCGVVGLKPTYGRLPLDGIFPLSASLDTVGPLARTVADAVVVYLVMANRASEVETVWERYPESGTSLEGRKIGVLRGFFTERVQSSVAASFEEAIGTVRNLGAEIVECEWDEALHARTVASVISRAESAHVHRAALRTAPEMIGEALRSRIELGAILPVDAYFQARAARVAIRDSIARLYREHGLDAVMAPTVPATAPKSGDPVEYDDGTTEEVGLAMTRFTGPFNATGQPIITVPSGFDDRGLPIGLSFVGRPDEELALADIAHAYEQAVGLWTNVAQ